VRFAFKSDRGILRETNEDYCNVITGYPDIPATFVIADGMGGHNSGEVASKMAVETVSDFIIKSPELFKDEKLISESIITSMLKANEKVFLEASEQESNHGMGTTMTIAAIYGEKLYLGHVGDSRAFLIRDNEIEKLTIDHTYIEELVKNGTITREQAINHPKRNVLTRAIGCEPNIAVDSYVYTIRKNDVVLLCTDGLTNMIQEREIAEVIGKNSDPEKICSELVSIANDRGGDDNITVVVFELN
jgi:protein phosphatase